MTFGYERISVVEEPIGRIVLQRPEKRNALDRQTLEELGRAAAQFDAADHVGVVVLSGQGPGFSAGVDLVQAADIRALGEAAFREFVALGRETARAIADMRAVTVASIHGSCVGGGMVLAAACDFRVAADDAVFSLPEVQLGFPVMWGGVSLLLDHMAAAVVKDLLMTCRRFDAHEANRMGFVSRVSPANDLETHTASLTADLAAKPQPALLATKRMVRAAQDDRLDLETEISEALEILTASGDLHSDS